MMEKSLMELSLLDELEQQHREAEDLLARLEQADEEAEQRRLVDELTTAMQQHMQIEEEQVYPALARLDGEAAEEADVEHGLARDGLSQLAAMIGQPGFGAAVAMVQAGIQHHVEEEEGEAFPRLREANGGDGRSSSTGSGRGGAEPTRDELYEQAQELGITGRSEMTKEQLRRAVEQAR